MFRAVARYGVMRTQEPARTELEDLRPLAGVVLRTERGTEYGTVIAPAAPVDEETARNARVQVLRRASSEDFRRQAELEGPVRINAQKLAEKLIGQQRLPMRLAYAEHLLGNERIFFYFVSETRVDFRHLVRELAHAFQTRIELRQVGQREAARLLGDCQACGQPLCCRSFIRKLEPITMSLARLQRQSLDPAKISGLCGKLKCCLRFEEQVYTELRKKLPDRNAAVMVGGQRGHVLSLDVYNQRVTVATAEGSVKTVKTEELAVLPPEPRAPAAEPPEAQEAEEEPQAEGEPAGPAQQSAAPGDGEPAPPQQTQ
jgi:cell fate regulator YaaT (PSP1 superfamily)